MSSDGVPGAVLPASEVCVGGAALFGRFGVHVPRQQPLHLLLVLAEPSEQALAAAEGLVPLVVEA